MFLAIAFVKFIGVSREAVRAKRQRHEVLGLKGAKRGLRFPKWQVTSHGVCCQSFQKSSICLAAIRGLFIAFSLNPNSDPRNLPFAPKPVFRINSN
jgi:hypothetical protein